MKWIPRSYTWVNWVFAPWLLDRGAVGQCLLCLLKVVKEELELAGDEIGVLGITGPDTDIDYIEAGIDESANGGQLREDQGGSLRCG